LFQQPFFVLLNKCYAKDDNIFFKTLHLQNDEKAFFAYAIGCITRAIGCAIFLFFEEKSVQPFA
jgi:hypothetical protein